MRRTPDGHVTKGWSVCWATCVQLGGKGDMCVGLALFTQQHVYRLIHVTPVYFIPSNCHAIYY